MKARPIILAAALAGVSATACSSYNDARGIGDAPVGKKHEAPRQVWVNIDGFMNVSAFCIGPNGVYTHTREATPIIIPDDRNCVEGGLLFEAKP